MHKYYSYNIKKTLIYQTKKPKKIVQEHKIKPGKQEILFRFIFSNNIKI